MPGLFYVHSSKQWSCPQRKFYLSENLLRPGLQFPGSMLSILMNPLRAAANHDFPELNDLKDKPVVPPETSSVQEAEELKAVIRSANKVWRGFQIYKDKFRINENILQTIKDLLLKAIARGQQSQESSFLMALLAESVHRSHTQILEIREFAPIFNRQRRFMRWLNESFPHYFWSFSSRVAFLYYIFELSRLNPEMWNLVSRSENWESPEPVAELWKGFESFTITSAVIDTTRGKEFFRFLDGITISELHSKIWQSIARLPIPVPDASHFRGAKSDRIKSLLKRAYDLWRPSITQPRNMPRSKTKQIRRERLLKFVDILAPATKNDIHSPCTSLFLAVAADSDLNPRFPRFFRGHTQFISWLNDMKGRSQYLLPARIAYRYFVLESLRLSPELSRSISNECGWESLQPVDDIREACLKIWFPSQPDSPSQRVLTARPNVADGMEEPLDFSIFGKNFLEFVGRPDIGEDSLTWKHIIDTSVPFPKLTGLLDADSLQIRQILHSGYDEWRGTNLPRRTSVVAESQILEDQILDLIRLLAPHSKRTLQSRRSSLLLAILAETAHFQTSFQTSALEKFSGVFANHLIFSDWLNSVPPSSESSLLDRIAYRYYVLENLRLCPELSKLISDKCGWKSFRPVDEIWAIFLNRWFCPSSSISNALTTHDASMVDHGQPTDFDRPINCDRPTDFDRPINLTRLKFLLALMMQVDPVRQRETTLKAWEKVLFDDPIFISVDGNMGDLWNLRQNFCLNLGISDCCRSGLELNTKIRTVRDCQNQVDNEFLWRTSMAMLAETSLQWQSPEWLLVLSIDSICRTTPNYQLRFQSHCAVNDLISEWLKNAESRILTESKTILERVLFRYFALLCLRRNAILQNTSPTLLCDLWESCKMESILQTWSHNYGNQISITRRKFREMRQKFNSRQSDENPSQQCKSFWNIMCSPGSELEWDRFENERKNLLQSRTKPEPHLFQTL
eukprot:Gregarina_sp_Poly_1__3137@NODE_1888_length_3132_cov_20_212398_g1225_i0_p1_GENE_NODE_1888_length_3132_cov_20_212398_g1225_i0NODE_1888_length_3132_cov_20_212398_g1225_i0_p1_ORF_typecomplete_len967_score131_89FANCI_HD1/PF14679_6/0_68FANCI_HD1/PF14679_6/1_7e02_NODE_1888_length_3132_cov_20_212398_g1225_i0932993